MKVSDPHLQVWCNTWFSVKLILQEPDTTKLILLCSKFIQVSDPHLAICCNIWFSVKVIPQKLDTKKHISCMFKIYHKHLPFLFLYSHQEQSIFWGHSPISFPKSTRQTYLISISPRYFFSHKLSISFEQYVGLMIK